MKWVLVDKGDNIIDKVELDSNYDNKAAKMFYVSRKQIDEKEFDNMWKVMSEEQYNTQRDLMERQQSKQYEWWKDDNNYLDIDR
tara:strand:+ start:1138 stop:1389 length:252 start_codon:yes stop_codon:yes gene_type:complete